MTWQELESDISALARKVTDKPDVVVAVIRGGIVPARLLATKFGAKTMYALTVVKTGGERTVTTEISENLSGLRVLLVEDALESGRSLIAAKKYLEKHGAIVQTLALYVQQDAEITPDYFLSKTSDIPSFPWE